MAARKQSSTSYPIQFLMVSSTDHVTAVTGLSPTVTLSKNGGAFGAASGAVTEISSGWYSLAGNATDRGTVGELLIHATGTGADPVDMKIDVVPEDPFAADLGLVGVVAASVTGAVGSVTGNVGGNVVGSVASVTGAVASVTGNVGGNVVGSVASVTGNLGGNVVGSVASVTGNVGGNVTGSVGSIATGGIVAGSIAASALNGKGDWNIGKTGYALSAAGVQAVWDALTSALTTVGSIGKMLVDRITGVLALDSTVAKDATVALDATVAKAVTALSTATWTAPRAAALDNLDATVSSRLASSGYTVPPSAASVSTAVWTEPIPGAFAAGSAGAALDEAAQAAAGSDPAAIADAVWDELLSGHAISGSTGAALSAINGATSTLGSATVTVVGPVLDSGTVSIVKGDDYASAEGRRLSWTSTSWPDLTGATITLGIRAQAGYRTTVAGVVVSSTAVAVALTAAQTAALPVGSHRFDLQATLLNGHVVTLTRGVFEVGEDYA